MWVQVTFSILTFTTLFILLTMVLGFWGRQILNLAKIRGTRYGQTLPMAAGLALLVFLGQALFPWVQHYKLFLTIFYFTGLAGTVAETVLFYRKFIRPSANQYDFIVRFLFRHDTFLASVSLAVIFSLVYSVVWPSGQMDVWMDTSTDFFSWIFIGEYLFGGVNPQVLDINPTFSYMLMDAFGTYNIIDFIAAANFKNPLLASSAVLVTLLVWWGTAVYSLLRKCFGFKFIFSLLLTLGVALGWLFNYLAIFGLFGNLVSITAFLIALEQLIPTDKPNWTESSLKWKLFFPLGLFFLSYQAGYVQSAILIIFTGFLMSYFYSKNGHFLSRLFTAIKSGFWPVIFVTALWAVLMPGVFYHMTQVWIQTANHVATWRVPLFSPWLLAGLPYYPQNFFYFNHITESAQIPVYYYIPIIIITITCLISIIKLNLKKEKTLEQQLSIGTNFTFQPRAVLVLTIVYLTSLLAYLAAFLSFEHIFQVWTLAAHTALPLSFIPTALAFGLVIRLFRQKYQYMPYIISVLAIVLFCGQFHNTKIIEIPSKYYNMNSARHFIRTLQQINSDIPKSSTIIVDLDYTIHNFIASIIFSDNSIYKVKFISPLKFVSPSLNYYKLFSRNTYILSDIHYDGIINSSFERNISERFFVYDYFSIRNQGYVAIQGNNLFNSNLSKYSNFNWRINQNPIYSTFIIPYDKINKDLTLSIELSPTTNAPLPCQVAKIGVFRENSEIIWSESEIQHLLVPIPAEMTAKGILKTVLEVGPFPKIHSTNIDQYPSANVCNFDIVRFNLH